MWPGVDCKGLDRLDWKGTGFVKHIHEFLDWIRTVQSSGRTGLRVLV